MMVVIDVPGFAVSKTRAVYDVLENEGALSFISAITTVTVAVDES